MRTVTVLSSTFLAVVCLAGCAVFQGPAVGDWSGPVSASPSAGGLGALAAGFATAAIGNTPATLTLKSDGTGYLKLPTAPERPVTWKADGDRVLLFVRKEGDADKGGAILTSGRSPSPEDALIGRLSEDKKTLTFDLGPVQVAMTKPSK